MSQLAPLAIVVPILAACVFMAGDRRTPRWVGDLGSLAVAAATTALCALLLAHNWSGPGQVYWMGGWHPRPGGVAIGIDLVVDPLSAGAATFAALLMTAALLYSQHYFEDIAPFYPSLMLVFLAGMVGFSLSGDLFNMFVFFELMSAPAYALTGYQTEERGPTQGALSFGVTNSLGAFMTLTGIGLLYGRTGALNLVQIGHLLAGHSADPLVVVAFVLVLTGFLVKAAAVPFHFWLADAHASAPVPVCVLFSGIMVQLGVYGVARVYWSVFSGPAALHAPALVHTLLVLGIVTTLVGAVMAFLQQHLKRLLAFSTISHTGMFLVGLAVLRTHGTSAVALFVVAHGCVKAALFMLVGIVGNRLGSLDEVALHGRGRELWATGTLFAIGGLALASLPPFGPFLGKALVEEAASERGFAWVAPVFMVASALAGGAVLRAALGIFLGVGEPMPPAQLQEGHTEETAEEDVPETPRQLDHTPPIMFVPAALLLAAGLGIAFVGRVKEGFEHAAALLQDRAAYADHVLHGKVVALAPLHVATGPHTASFLWSAGAVVGAVLAAVAALELPRLHGLGRLRETANAAAGLLRTWHSGHIGDYATWLVGGVVCLGWALGASLT